MKTNDIDPRDYKYIVKTPDKNFSPARNKAIINETIRETEKFFSQLNDTYQDELGGRIEILASYGRYRFNRGDKSIEKYLGKKLYSQVIGEKILEKVKVMDSVNKLNNNKKFSKSILL